MWELQSRRIYKIRLSCSHANTDHSWSNYSLNLLGWQLPHDLLGIEQHSGHPLVIVDLTAGVEERMDIVEVAAAWHHFTQSNVHCNVLHVFYQHLCR